MSGYFIGTSIVINDDAAYVHESFSTVGVGTTENVKITTSDGAADVQDWVDNAVHNRARIAIDEICKIYTEHKLSNNEPITVVGKDAMVLTAFEESLVKTGAQRNQEAAEQMNSLPA